MTGLAGQPSNYADFGTQKLFIDLTESGADYCRVGASIVKPGRSGRSFAFIYLFILDINRH